MNIRQRTLHSMLFRKANKPVTEQAQLDDIYLLLLEDVPKGSPLAAELDAAYQQKDWPKMGSYALMLRCS